MKIGMTTEKTIDVKAMVAEYGSLAKAALAQILICIDEAGLWQTVYDENGTEYGIEINSWTSGGVEMRHLIDLRDEVAAGYSATDVFVIAKEMRSLANDFDVDEEIDVMRNDAAYRADFTYAQASKDFSEWKLKLEVLAKRVWSVVALYEQMGLCPRDFAGPDFSLQSVLSKSLEREPTEEKGEDFTKPKKVRKIWGRGKRTDTGEWVYGMPLFDWADCSLKCKNQHNGKLLTFLGWSDEFHEYQEFEVDPDTVGMSTGMANSYDVEVFEGDVCNFTAVAPDSSDIQFRGVVVYDGSRYMLWKSPEEECFGFYGGFDLDWVLAQDDELTVIGNIHDAPQLLQQK